MQRHNERIGIRLPSDLREQTESLIRQGKYRNLSEVIRAALTKFLEENEKA